MKEHDLYNVRIIINRYNFKESIYVLMVEEQGSIIYSVVVASK